MVPNRPISNSPQISYGEAGEARGTTDGEEHPRVETGRQGIRTLDDVLEQGADAEVPGQRCDWRADSADTEASLRRWSSFHMVGGGLENRRLAYNFENMIGKLP